MQHSFFRRTDTAAAFAVLCIVLTTTVTAQNSPGPQPVPMPPPIAAPADTPYPGPISLIVDVTNTTDRILNVHETIPVKGRDVTLLYPEWLPGTHSPSNPVESLAGLMVTAGGKRVPWVRDRVNMYAFHVEVPKDATTLEINFQFLAALDSKRSRISSKFADVTWNSVLLYPAGYFARDIKFETSIHLPEAWKFACSLDVKSQNGNVVQFKETTLNTLIDSPLYAGVNFKRLDLSTGSDNPVYLDVFAEKPADLEITSEELQYHKNLVIEAQKLFNSRHYDRYDFLFSVSDTIGGKGLEHHQSSEDGSRANYFTDWGAGVGGRALLPHEYTHSWNGKFRRPADLWTPNFNVPMRNDLLWVYEGLTDYYGNVLTARSGMRTPEQARDVFAQIAAGFEISPGRTWRSLEDTTNEPIVSSHGAVQQAWTSWQRSYDYYPESDLVWLDADTKIRELSDGKKSLDDFAKLFFGSDNGSYVTVGYTLDDLVKALNIVQPYDWAGFFRTRVHEVNPNVPENGFTQGGYRLVYNDNEPEWMKKSESVRGASFADSLGFSIKSEAGGDSHGNLENVWWDSLAFKAGITPDMQLQAVNDQKYTAAALREAILAAEKTKEPIKLLLKRGDDFVTVSLDYHGGMRYPHLERVETTPDRLDAILAPAK
ncbi:MAG TPA: peptidase M61 [Candidatus Sulfotelmatobacter sp.]|nr:peptidase M61 [Candidatus Sulfotelmatobacter sp.]